MFLPKAAVTPSPPASTSTSPHEMAPHLPAPTSVPLPGPSEPVKLACPPNLGNEADLEKTVADLTTALQMMDMDDGAGSPQPAVAETKVADGSKGKSQLTLKDMPAAVWLPRLKKGSVDTPPVAVEDKTGVCGQLPAHMSKLHRAFHPSVMYRLPIMIQQRRTRGQNLSWFYSHS